MSIDMGLCAGCSWMRRIASGRGSVFCLCQRSATDPRFPKYPPLPVVTCDGYERGERVSDPQSPGVPPGD